MHIPKYRKKPGRDWAFVEKDGQRVRLPGSYDSPESRDAYAAFVSRLVSDNHEPPEVHPGEPILVAVLVSAYLDHARQYYRGGNGWHGEYANCKYALSPLLEAFGGFEANSFGPLKLKEIQKRLVESGRSRTYINQVVAKIKRCFKWAASEELVRVETYQALATVQGLAEGRSAAKETQRRQPVPWEHVKAIIDDLPATVRAMLQVQWYTGARSGSICAATAGQFDRTLGSDHGEVWLWRPKHKTQWRGAELVLPVGPKCQAVLSPFLEAAEKKSPDAYLFSPRAARPNRRYGASYTSRSYRQAIKRAVLRYNATLQEQAGKAISKAEQDAILAALVPNWTPHQVRHSKGTAVRHKYGAEAAQAILGHEDLDATLIYSERRLDLAKSVARETG